MAKEVEYNKTPIDGKTMHCPFCKVNFNYIDVMNGEFATVVDSSNRIYKCSKCEKDFILPR